MSQHTACYHCHLPIVPSQKYFAVVLGEQRAMCCPGCQAVAESIVQNGLEDYYRYRTQAGEKADAMLDETFASLSDFDSDAIQKEFVLHENDHKQVQLSLEGIHCAACGWLIEKQLTKLDGVVRVAVNVTARRATVLWQDERVRLSEILSAIERIGYHALPFQQARQEAIYHREGRSYLRKLGLSGLLTMQVMMIAVALYFGVFGSIEPETKHYLHWVSLLLSLPVVGYAGFGFYKSAVTSLRARFLNMDVSISLAVLGTFLSSAYATVIDSGDVYFESVCMFIFLLLVSRYIEHRTRYQAAQISSNLQKNVPATATLLSNEGVQKCLVSELVAGQTIRVISGETIPVDGVVIDGSSEVNESMLSGEFAPVHKAAGDAVFGGTVNAVGVITVEVERPFKASLINQIIHLQELALSQKPAIAAFADRATQWFVAAVLVIALGSYLAWQFIEPERAFWVAIAVLVATCPCALGLATPSALISGLARLKRHGVLVKRADALEQVAEADTVIFDKTGTLTEGKFQLVKTEVFSDANEDKVLALAAAVEQSSEHPISRAFEHIAVCSVAQDVKVIPGCGISASVDGNRYKIGSAQFLGLTPSDHTHNVYLARDNQLLAGFTVTDGLRAESKALVKSLAAKRLMILSGDAETNVKQVAEQLGIAEYHAECSPERKLAIVRNLQSQGSRVMMLGDGLNDAPVLAAAEVSMAVGEASDITKRSADIILLKTNVSGLSVVFSQATRIMSKIRQNLGWAVGYNLLVLPLAVCGLLTPWIAVLGMSFSALVVVINATRLLR